MSMWTKPCGDQYTDDSTYCIGGKPGTRLYFTKVEAENKSGIWIANYDPDDPNNTQGKKVRCPVCNKRLYLRAYFCFGGELTGFSIPMHKPKGHKIPKKRKVSKEHYNGRHK